MMHFRPYSPPYVGHYGTKVKKCQRVYIADAAADSDTGATGRTLKVPFLV